MHANGMLTFTHLLIFFDKEGMELGDQVRLSNKLSSQWHMPG